VPKAWLPFINFQKEQYHTLDLTNTERLALIRKLLLQKNNNSYNELVYDCELQMW